MKYTQQTDSYIVRLEKGEQLIDSLNRFAADQKLQGAFMYGLGGAQSATLAMYLLDEQRYENTDFSGPLEIVSLTGNIAQKEDGGMMVHCHAVISGRDLAAYAGHLVEATVGGTIEIFIDLRSSGMVRRHDDAVGLALLNFEEHDSAK